MNINIRIDITPGTARRFAYIGLTFLVVGLAAVAYAVPVTFASHQKLTADQLNQNFGDLEARVVALAAAVDSKAAKSELPIVTDWQAYTPVVLTEHHGDVPGQPVAGLTTVGHYRRVGDSLEATIVTTFNAAPKSGARWWEWSLPEGASIDFSRVGNIGDATVGGGLAQALDQNFTLGAYVRSGNTVSGVPNGASSLYLTDNNPFAFDSGATINLYFTVPIVGWGAGK